MVAPEARSDGMRLVQQMIQGDAYSRRSTSRTLSRAPHFNGAIFARHARAPKKDSNALARPIKITQKATRRSLYRCSATDLPERPEGAIAWRRRISDPSCAAQARRKGIIRDAPMPQGGCVPRRTMPLQTTHRVGQADGSSDTQSSTGLFPYSAAGGFILAQIDTVARDDFFKLLLPFGKTMGEVFSHDLQRH